MMLEQAKGGTRVIKANKAAKAKTSALKSLFTKVKNRDRTIPSTDSRRLSLKLRGPARGTHCGYGSVLRRSRHRKVRQLDFPEGKLEIAESRVVTDFFNF